MIYPLVVLIFGSIIGSFLNVLILRYGNGVLKSSRSKCFSCGHTLDPSDLIPIFSFLFLGGKCRYCGSKISIQYPLVEFFTALSFLLTYLKLGWSLETLFYWVIWSIFIAIFVYDLKHKIIPNGLVYILIVLSLLKIIFIIWLGFNEDLFWLILSGPIIASPFALLWLVSRGRWMGFGDAKLALAIGWLLGLSQAFSALILAFWIGAIVGLLLVFLSKMTLLSQKFKNFTIKSEIPFAPFLIIGTAIIFWGDIDIFYFLFI